MAEPTSEKKPCIPEGIGLDLLNLVLIAYLKAGADRKAVSYRDASLRSGVAHTMVSVNNKFFVYAGFLTEEGKGQFKLTERGAKYTQMLDWGRLEEAKAQLRLLLLECSVVGVILDYVALRKEVLGIDLNAKIGSDAKVSRAKRFVTGTNTLIDMLVFSELLKEENGMLSRTPLQTRVTPAETPETPASVSESVFGKSEFDIMVEKARQESSVVRPKRLSIPVSLTFSVDNSTDIQKLRDILQAIREELLEEKRPSD